MLHKKPDGTQASGMLIVHQNVATEILEIFKKFEMFFRELNFRKSKFFDGIFLKVNLLIKENRFNAVSERFREFKSIYLALL